MPLLHQSDSSPVGHLCRPEDGHLCPRCQTYWAVQVATGAYDWEKKEWTPLMDQLNRRRAKGLLTIRVTPEGELVMIERTLDHAKK